MADSLFGSVVGSVLVAAVGGLINAIQKLSSGYL